MRARTRLVAVATAILVAVGLTLPVAALLTDTFGGSDRSDDGWDRDPRASNDPPRIGNQLAVCVQGIDVDSFHVETAKLVIESTLEEIADADPRWLDATFPNRLVHVGCPYPPALDRYHLGRVVFSGSYYRTFVYILPDDQLRRRFAADPGSNVLPALSSALVTAEESTCGGDHCSQETYGLYLTPEHLEDENRFLYEMYWALYAGHIAMLPGPPEPYQEPQEPVEAQLPPNN